MSLRDVVLPMATDTRLRQLAEDGGLRWDFEAGYAPLYLKGNWEQPERVKLVLMLVVPVKQTVTYRASFGHVVLFQEYRKRLRSK